jgi:hypothetical protein
VAWSFIQPQGLMSMKTELMRPNFSIPVDQELIELLGEEKYGFYKILCKKIISSFDPDLERWDDGSRRGKYFHGYYVHKKFIEIHLFLGSENLTCYFEIRKRHRDRLLKKISIFSEKTQKETEEYGDFPFGFIIDDDTFQDVIKVLEILSSTGRNPASAVGRAS